MGTILLPFGLVIMGYFLGSLPFALWVTRLVKGVDVRNGGSGHITTTNTIRQAGWIPGIIVFVFDISKGYLPVYMAIHLSQPDWLIMLVAMMAVVGHCWTIFAGFRGGMGLAVAGGAILAVSPLGFISGLGFLIALVLLIKHAARGSILTGFLLALFYWMIGFRGTLLWVGGGLGLVIAIRFFRDWNRKYRELWLDRENQTNVKLDAD